MNIIDYNILNTLFDEKYSTQRNLSNRSGYSLGKVNQSLTALKSNGFLNESNNLTDKAHELANACKPENAIILAAGMGMRMVPLNTMISKGLLEVNGEILIERQIRQLHEAGIKDITIIVGFMKESYDYLIDKYGVKLVINTEYSKKNNLHTLNLVSNRIGNTYIIPSDLWCKNNPFSSRELYSWFMVTDRMDERSYLRVNRKQELVEIDPEEDGNDMVGISYILKDDAEFLIHNLHDMDRKKRHSGSFWEDALMDNDRLQVWANVVEANDVIEINSYQQVKELLNDPNTLNESEKNFIAAAMNINSAEIEDIHLLKNGLTNRTLKFKVKDEEYAVRIPHQDIRQFIDRSKEYSVYEALKGSGFSEDVLFFDMATGIKISRYLEDTHHADMHNASEIKLTIQTLKKLHESGITVEKQLDVFSTIESYEALRNGKSLYCDYENTKSNVLKLRNFLEYNKTESVLCHSEAVSDNVLISSDGKIRLIDWEYSGMEDPCMDLAMTAIYSGFDKSETDTMLDYYYEGSCSDLSRHKVYAYMAACGLLWSNWCEYKTGLGVEFGEYAMRQYRYAKDFYRYTVDN